MLRWPEEEEKYPGVDKSLYPDNPPLEQAMEMFNNFHSRVGNPPPGFLVNMMSPYPGGFNGAMMENYRRMRDFALKEEFDRPRNQRIEERKNAFLKGEYTPEDPMKEKLIQYWKGQYGNPKNPLPPYSPYNEEQLMNAYDLMRQHAYKTDIYNKDLARLPGHIQSRQFPISYNDQGQLPGNLTLPQLKQQHFEQRALQDQTPGLSNEEKFIRQMYRDIGKDKEEYDARHFQPIKESKKSGLRKYFREISKVPILGQMLQAVMGNEVKRDQIMKAQHHADRMMREQIARYSAQQQAQQNAEQQMGNQMLKRGLLQQQMQMIRSGLMTPESVALPSNMNPALLGTLEQLQDESNLPPQRKKPKRDVTQYILKNFMPGQFNPEEYPES